MKAIGGFFSYITFRNIVLLVVVIAILTYILPFLINNSNNITSLLPSSKDSFASIGYISDTSGFLESLMIGNLGSNKYNDNVVDICINGDRNRRIPSCATRNRCDMLDQSDSADCIRNCSSSCRAQN